LDPAKPESFAQRKAAASAVQARYGGPMKLLTDEEASDLATRMAGSVNDAMQAVQTIAAFGGRAVAAAAAQIAPKDPRAAQLAVLAARPFGVGRQVLATVKEGEQRLAGDAKMIDREAAAEALTETLGTSLALRPQLAAVVRDLADKYYAGVAGRRGTAQFDASLYGNAVASVLGRWVDSNGVARGGLGTDASGAATMLPSDLSQDQFDTSISGISDEALAKFGARAPVDMRGKPISADIIRGGQMLPVADGRYRVMIDGKLVSAKDGRPFEVQIGGAR
jgi:hypothetical protein